MEYIVFFQLFGKKMKTPVKADSPEAAIAHVRSQLEILKVEKLGPTQPPKGDTEKIDEFLKAWLGI